MPYYTMTTLQTAIVERALGGRYMVALHEPNKVTAKHLDKLAREGVIERCPLGWSNPTANLLLP